MPARRPWGCLPLALLILAAGCEDEPINPKPKVKAREVIGQKTQDIKEATPENIGPGAVPAETRITAKDPLTLSGNAYVTSIDRIAMMNIQHALDLYNAEHGNYPKSYQEFMDEIIRPGRADGIQLPQLPAYQDYYYNVEKHQLEVWEYPEKKAQLREQVGKGIR